MSINYGFDPGASRDVGVAFYEECSKTIANGTCPGHHAGVVTVTYEQIGGGTPQSTDNLSKSNRADNGEDVRRVLRSGCIHRNAYSRKDYCIGNGQLGQLKLSELVGALNCMHDNQIVLREVDDESNRC